MIIRLVYLIKEKRDQISGLFSYSYRTAILIGLGGFWCNCGANRVEVMEAIDVMDRLLSTLLRGWT